MSKVSRLLNYTVEALTKDSDFVRWVLSLIKRSSVSTTSVQSIIDHPYKGGQSFYTADGVTTVYDITHNLGAEPSFFTLTTTQPIPNNLLNRTITFPDLNTMRITYQFAPNEGENANYVWIVYK